MKYSQELLVAAALSAIILLAAGCKSAVEPPPPPPPPPSGDLVVRIATPNGDDRAVQLTIICPGTIDAMTPESGYDVHHSNLQGNSASLIVVRQAGQSIPSGASLVHIHVQNLNGNCDPTINSVAFQGYGVRASLSGYSASVGP